MYAIIASPRVVHPLVCHTFHGEIDIITLVFYLGHVDITLNMCFSVAHTIIYYHSILIVLQLSHGGN